MIGPFVRISIAMTDVYPPASPVPPPRRRGSHRWLILVAVVLLTAATVASGYALNRSRVATEAKAAQSFAVGDCVVVPSTPPPGDVHAQKAPCSLDPSYTIGAVTDASGSCPSKEYQRFPAEIADPPTSTLCLVPNLVVDHCYTLDMPLGMVKRADCGERGADVRIQITQRLDAHDQQACPAGQGNFAWPYPSPARTYCTISLY